MNKRKPLKILFLIMIFAMSLLLVGAGWFSIGLRNVDSDNPLVKIDVLIGGSGMPDPSKTPQTETDKDNDDSDKEGTNPVISSEIRVRVRGKNIFINDTMTPESAFEQRFYEQYDESEQVILVDDYADYQTYVKIIEFFNENGIEIVEEKS